MSVPPKITLIVNTFNQPDYLTRVLTAVAAQTRPPEETLLADDGSGQETREAFTTWARSQSFRTEHVWQPNEGFRRSRILNEAIARARGQYIVFLDGDTVPHPRFVEDHGALTAAGCFVQGHRALIEQRAARQFGRGTFGSDRFHAWRSIQLRGWANAFRWPLASIRFRTDLRGIRGCNLGIWRSDLLRVNGYNEAFVGWGREDSELAVRLMNSGVRRRDVRGQALCYHLWHPPASRGRVPTNDDLLARAINEARQRCEKGLDQHLPPTTA